MNTLPHVRVEHLSKRFGALDVLSDISFDVRRKKFTCIVGPSGCGKSTLLRILLDLETKSSGGITVNDGSDGDGNNIPTHTAYVPQKSLLLPWRTALQNISLGLEMQTQSPPTKNSLDFLRSSMARYGLQGCENTYPRELSGGMEQRVSILRAFARNPNLLICDEPFSSVDFVTRLKLNSEFRDLCLSAGTTVVFVTHNIEEALFFADDLIVLSGRPARIVKSYTPRFSVGRHDPVQVRQDPEFGRLFSSVWKDLEKGNDAI
jgi:NitT/TauT family transport system ATP-binding protein